jgi:hypothetical protein
MPSDDEILDALAGGLSIREAANRFVRPESEVKDLLREETKRCYDGAEMQQEWALTARRLRTIEVKFAQKGIDELDCAAAIVAIKANERRSTLTGSNAPQGHVVQLMGAAAAQSDSTQTQKARLMMDRFLHITPRERELGDAYNYDGDRSPATIAELNELRVARGKPPLVDGDSSD